MGTVEFFDQLARSTDSYLNTARMVSLRPGVFKLTMADIDRKITLQKTDSVLDLGGGCGQLTELLAVRCGSVVLCDGAASVLETAQRQLQTHSNVSYVQADITKLPLPFGDSQFDTVICYSVVHYLQSMAQFAALLDELLRIVKPGGKILVGDMPLVDRYQKNLAEREKNKVRKILLNLRYRMKRGATQFLYKRKGLDPSQVSGMRYDRQAVLEVLNQKGLEKFEFIEQDRRLPSADSREDLLIVKESYEN